MSVLLLFTVLTFVIFSGGVTVITYDLVGAVV